MEEPIRPEEDLAKDLHHQMREIHGHLFHLHQLYIHCCDESLSMQEVQKRCHPILNKLRKENPVVAREIQELLQKKDRKKLLDYFENEKQALTETLSDENIRHQAIEKDINQKKEERFPTDS